MHFHYTARLLLSIYYLSNNINISKILILILNTKSRKIITLLIKLPSPRAYTAIH